MNQEELNKILDSLDKKAYSMIRSWLFDKANEFAPDDKALYLHNACNHISKVIRDVEPDYFPYD